MRRSGTNFILAAGVILACLSAMLPQGVFAQAQDRAQPQEKRIALVIGNGAYARAPLATAANDAGLIAQTLQAAGFDVVGARDLDGETLRKSLRDFMQKAESSGPDTVAMIYLAGYGIQLAGENYFIPVDSTLSRDVDIPTEGLRVSDYMRQLSALPLKAGIVVLDAAREQPFVTGQPIASGLALIEPDPKLLIAFNAAPGTVAPEEQGPYGAYAQALAEMIRFGGLPLPELFNRVRLRVNDVTKGAQVPWDTQKVEAQFLFFDRAPDAPKEATPDQAASLRDKPIRDLGAQDAYAAALDRDTLQGYEDFLGAYPDDPMAKRVRAIVAARREAITWRRTYRADTPDAYWSYLKRYPRGPHAADARRRLSILTAPLEPPQSFAMYDYDVPPPPPEEIVYVDRPVLMFSDPEFDFVPPPPPPLFFLPPPPPDFIDLAPPPLVYGLFVLPQPIFVPIPIFVRPPIYVRPPPPSNIIFANIHNRRMIDTVINRPMSPDQLAARGLGGRGGAFVPPGIKGPTGGRPAAPLAATATLPASVAQRASLIQQGKAPVPPSARINPAARTNLTAPAGGQPGARGLPRGPRGFATNPAAINGAPGAQVPGAAPGARPGVPGQGGPNALPGRPGGPNALPVPGRGGAPGLPPGARGPRPGASSPAAQPGGAAPSAPAAPSTAAPNLRPAPGAPSASGPAGRVGREGGPGPRPGRDAAPGGRDAPRAAPQATQPRAAPQIQRPAPSAQRPAPPPRVSPPPHRQAPPMARPSAPPPRMAPPPVRQPPPMARPAAPPPRMAPPPVRQPPPMARPAAPPPRMAPPPPRPAAPPPRAAPAPAAKRCPPNVPKC